MAPKSFPVIDGLTATARLYFAALLLAQMSRLPVSPTRQMTLSLMRDLRDQSFIEVPENDTSWALESSTQRTPIEGLQWRTYIETSQFQDLLIPLRRSLQLVPVDDEGTSARVELWRQLAYEEAALFFEKQLLKHHFDAAWAQDLLYAYRDCSHPLSIASWRYCCWAATRHGASIAQQQRTSDTAQVREAIYAELQRRTRFLIAGKCIGCAFPPYGPEPHNAIGRIFTSDLAPIGMRFWTMPPAIEGLAAVP